MRGVISVTAVLIAGLLGTQLLSAQESGGFRGRVTDPSGAAVPAVVVTVEEERTGLTQQTVSNDAGEFEVRALESGAYTISAEATNFKRYVNTGLVLYTGQVRRVDVRLEVGQVTETVEVVADAPVIETDSATISYKQGNQEIYHLNQMTAGWLIYTLANHPGVDTRSQVHGSYANNAKSAQDGVNMMGYSKQGRPPQEMVQEISQVSLNAPAEYQHATTVTGTGYRGTNDLHAEFLVEYRHDRLNAPARGAERQPAKPNYLWNIMGSGPVYIPKVYDGRNKTFFRFMYQPDSVDGSFLQQGFDAPTPALRAGDMNQIVNIQKKQVRDPLTGQPFPGNVIPQSRISPVAINAMELIPLPNTGGPDRLTDNFDFFNHTTEDNAWQHYRIDHQITPSNTISVSHMRFFRDTLHTADDSPFNGIIDRDATTRAVSVRDTHVLSPNVINELTFAWNRQERISQNGAFRGAELVDSLGFSTGGRQLPDAVGSPLLKLTTFRSNKNNSIIGGRSAQDQINTDAHVYSLRNNVSINWGRHLIKTGFDVNWQRPFTDAISTVHFGVLNYTGNYSGSDWADFMLGLPRTTSIATPRAPIRSRHMELGFFVQDDWKVNPRLTVTPGVRFQHYGVPFDASGQYYNFDLANLRVVVPDSAALQQVSPAYPAEIPVVTAADAGYPSKLANFKNLLVEPRIGIAYRPFGENFVVRMGYGIYHVPYARPTAASAGELIPGRTGGPFSLTENFGPSALTNGVPELTSANPFPAGPGKVGLQSVTALPVDLRADRWPYDQQWNVTVEKGLPLGFAFRGSYVGSKGTNWPYLQNLQIPPASTEKFSAARRPYGAAPYSSIILNELGGSATYNGLELELTRQFSSGLYLRAWYDYRRALNDVDGGLFGDTDGIQPENPYDRARDRGWQNGVVPHRMRFVAVYELPFGRGKKVAAGAPGWLNHIIGGWSVTPFLTIQSSQRYTPVFSGSDPSNTGVSGGRPDASCDGNGFGSAPGTKWDKSCFSVPQNGTYGSAERGSLLGPTIWKTSFNAFKTWRLAPGDWSPYLRFEFYSDNIFNHSNAELLGSNNISSSAFGVFRVNARDVRSIYFRLRLGF